MKFTDWILPECPLIESRQHLYINNFYYTAIYVCIKMYYPLLLDHSARHLRNMNLSKFGKYFTLMHFIWFCTWQNMTMILEDNKSLLNVNCFLVFLYQCSLSPTTRKFLYPICLHKKWARPETSSRPNNSSIRHRLLM